MTHLLKDGKKGGKLHFTAEVHIAFNMLEQKLVSMPVLITPDPRKPFIVEVDVSEVGIGAIHGTPEKLHPCAFFSQK